MAYLARPSDFHGATPYSPAILAPVPQQQTRHGFWRSLFDAVFESRQRHAERSVEAYLERTGGRFTDSIEREISNRMMRGSGWDQR